MKFSFNKRKILIILLILIIIVLSITLPLVLLKKSSSNSSSINVLPTTTKPLIPFVPKINYMYSYTPDPNTEDSNPPIYLNVYWTLPQNIQCKINYCPILDNSNTTCINNQTVNGYIINNKDIIDNKSPNVQIPILKKQLNSSVPDDNVFFDTNKIKAVIIEIQNTSGFILPKYTEYIIPAFTDSTPNEWIQL